MAKTSQKLSALCIDCDKRIPFKKEPRLDETVICPHCDAMLMVVELNPIELDWAYEDDDDYDYDYDDD
jgi:lysine biosynthesis protein LysW